MSDSVETRSLSFADHSDGDDRDPLPGGARRAVTRDAIRLFASILAVLVICEAIVMAILNALGLRGVWDIALDPLLLAVLATPLLCWLVVRPAWRMLLRKTEAEAEVRQARARLGRVIEATPEPFLVIDRDHRVVMANKAARDMAGGIDPAKVDVRCYQMSHHRDEPCNDAEHPCPLQRVVATGQSVHVTHTRHTADGEPRITDVLASPIFDASGEVAQIIEICHDVTDRTRAEEDMKAVMGELEQFNRLAVGRENRMIELKREVNELSRKAGVAPPYDLAAIDVVSEGAGHE